MFNDLVIDLPKLGDIVGGLLEEFGVLGILGKEVIDIQKKKLFK